MVKIKIILIALLLLGSASVYGYPKPIFVDIEVPTGNMRVYAYSDMAMVDIYNIEGERIVFKTIFLNDCIRLIGPLKIKVWATEALFFITKENIFSINKFEMEDYRGGEGV